LLGLPSGQRVPRRGSRLRRRKEAPRTSEAARRRRLLRREPGLRVPTRILLPSWGLD